MNEEEYEWEMKQEVISTCDFCRKEKDHYRKTCWKKECKKAYKKAYMKAYYQRKKEEIAG